MALESDPETRTHEVNSMATRKEMMEYRECQPVPATATFLGSGVYVPVRGVSPQGSRTVCCCYDADRRGFLRRPIQNHGAFRVQGAGRP